MSIADPFKSIIDDFVKNVENKEQREKMEDYAVMLGSIAAAESVPGLGEVQLGLQFLDFIDPYGYNQALNRKSVDEMLSNQYTTIQDMQASVLKCYQTQDAASCAKSGISSEQLSTFAGYSPNVQEKLLKTVGSWLTPIDPIVRFPSALPCTIATRPEFMSNNCKNEEYKGYYFDYWNKNVKAYEANAEAAEEAAAASAAAGLSGDTEQDSTNTSAKNKLKMILACIFAIATLVVFMIASKVT
jgi:hypothetical protein